MNIEEKEFVRGYREYNPGIFPPDGSSNEYLEGWALAENMDLDYSESEDED